ncbi:MAG: sulfite exporter TauE/SafE family protein [Blastocatellia bacterium]|nr:sulfite exporter TauE/SafE family protein [Blastocatellia bacterium]
MTFLLLLFLSSLHWFLGFFEEPSLASLGAGGVLAVGFMYGLKHATEADHVVAVSTIVSQEKNLKWAAFVGAFWGAGHTASLFVVGLIVISLRINIPENISSWMEFGIAIMIIALGTNALMRIWRSANSDHQHLPGTNHTHDHDHQHSHSQASNVSTRGFKLKPIIIGTLHGLAGSAALTLLVLTDIKSPILGIAYLLIFGLGSIIGMLLMSGAIGLPFAMSSNRLTKFNYALQVFTPIFSIIFGCWYGYQTEIPNSILSMFMSVVVR